MMRTRLVSLALFGLVGCPSTEPRVCAPTTLIVRTHEVVRDLDDARRLVRDAREAQVGTLSILVKMDEDEEGRPSGEAFYASAFVPRAEGYASFDALRTVIDLAHAEGIEVLAWIPQFHDATAAAMHPEASMQTLRAGEIVDYVGANQERFVSPTHPAAEAYELRVIEEVARNYDVDGIVIDWVRYDGWATGMEPSTRDAFRAESGIDIAHMDISSESPERRAWGAFRAEQVASYVRDVDAMLARVNPELPFGVYVLPAEFADVSQDAGRFASAIDFVSPMLYFDDWGFTLAWVFERAVPEIRARVGENVEIIPALDEDWTDAQNQEVLVGLRSTPYVHAVTWFAYGDWSSTLVARLGPERGCP